MREKPFMTENGKGEIFNLTVNDGFTPIGKENKPATTVDPSKPVGKPIQIRDPYWSKE